MRRIWHSLLIHAGLLLPALLPAQAGSYAWSRMLSPVDSTAYYKLRIGSDILYKARPSGVVRVYELNEKDTAEVPYLLHETFEASVLKCASPVKLINASFVKGKASYYTCVVDTPEVYSSLTFDIGDGAYDKDLMLEGSDDNKHWKTILEKEKVFRFDGRGSEQAILRNTIFFPEQSYRYLRVTFDDSHSPRVALNSVQVPCFPAQDKLYEDEQIPMQLGRKELKAKKLTELSCTFPREYVVTGLRFKIGHDAPFYKRGIHIYQAAHKSQKPDLALYSDDYLVSNSSNYISLLRKWEGDEPNTSKLVIDIENQDDQPLRDIQVEAFTRTQTMELRLEKGKRYMLAYGKSNDEHPFYDMAYFLDFASAHLREAKLEREVQQLKPAAAPTPKEPFFKSAAWIWGLMIVSILVIGGFAVSLLRQSKAGKQD